MSQNIMDSGLFPVGSNNNDTGTLTFTEPNFSITGNLLLNGTASGVHTYVAGVTAFSGTFSASGVTLTIVNGLITNKA